MKRKRSWQTTLGGILAAIGQGLIAGQENVGTWAMPVGQVLSIIGLALLGIAARDNRVSSEDVGANGRTPDHW